MQTEPPTTEGPTIEPPTTQSPADGLPASQSRPTDTRPVFLGRPEPEATVEEFTLAVLTALLGADDPRVKAYEAEAADASGNETEADQR